MSQTAEATISSKGQIVIPQEVRKKAHLAEGDRLRFTVKDGEIIATKLVPQIKPYPRGSLKSLYTKELAEEERAIHKLPQAVPEPDDE